MTKAVFATPWGKTGENEPLVALGLKPLPSNSNVLLFRDVPAWANLPNRVNRSSVVPENTRRFASPLDEVEIVGSLFFLTSSLVPLRVNECNGGGYAKNRKR